MPMSLGMSGVKVCQWWQGLQSVFPWAQTSEGSLNKWDNSINTNVSSFIQYSFIFYFFSSSSSGIPKDKSAVAPLISPLTLNPLSKRK